MDLEIQAALQDAWNRIGEWIESAISGIPNTIAAILILVVFWMLARAARSIVLRILGRVSHYSAVNRLLSTLVYVGVIALGLLMALGALNLERTVTSILAGAGILGLAVGFAAQDSVENLIAGVMLSVRRPFREGELIETDDTFGLVHEINLRSTVIRTPTGQLVYTPNKDVLGNALTNYSESGARRVDVACGVSYADDLLEARKVAIETIEGLENRDAQKDVEFYYDEFGGSSIDFVVRFWIPFDRSNRVYLTAKSEAIIQLKRAFDEAGLTIPFPITTMDFGISGGVPLADQLSRRDEPTR